MISYDNAINLANDIKGPLEEVEGRLKYSKLDSYSTEVAGFNTVKITMSVGRFGSIEYILIREDIEKILVQGYQKTIIDIIIEEYLYYDVGLIFNDLRIEVSEESLSDDELYELIKDSKGRMEYDLSSITV